MMTLFVDRCYYRNHWYIIESGSFVGGPFLNKGQAISYMRERKVAKMDTKNLLTPLE